MWVGGSTTGERVGAAEQCDDGQELGRSSKRHVVACMLLLLLLPVEDLECTTLTKANSLNSLHTVLFSCLQFVTAGVD